MSGDVTYQALERLTQMPDETGNQGDVIAGQKYYDIYFTGGAISGVNISGLSSPLSISDGGTGQVTANAALNGFLPSQGGNTGKYLKTDGTNTSWAAGDGTGTVTSVSVTTANGVSGSVATATTTPAITLTLGAITPSTVNALTLASQTVGFTIAGGTTSKMLTVPLDASVSGTNTGDQTTISGNAGTATALQTSRNIGGVAFNGTADIVPQTIQSNNEATDTTCFPLFITASGTQSLQPKNNTGLTFNSNTAVLGVTGINFGGSTLGAYIENSYSPTPTGFTVVGTPSYSGNYIKVGKLVFVDIRITSTTSTSSTAGTSSLTLPFTASAASTCQAGTGNTSIGFGTGFVGLTMLFPPSWTANSDVTVTATYISAT